ncbi:hypothetical protein BH24CHL9_BH24CHL9_04250 [soil metagenome]
MRHLSGPPGTGRASPWRGSGREWLIPVCLFLTAAAIRAIVATQVPFPITEGSAYYIGVAHNIVEGDGLVSDAVWSYSTPPLVVPKPAFELWLPMASLVSALSMALLGPTFQAAQVGSVLLGALLAPLTWGVAQEAARAHGLDERRSRAVSLASGLLVAGLGPVVLAAVVPDSFTPYTVFSVGAALLAARLIRASTGEAARSSARSSLLGRLALGGLLGLAYLSRQEVAWLGLAVVMGYWSTLRRAPRGTRARAAWWHLAPVVVGGLCVVGPWLLRNMAELGSPLPGQALQNLWLLRNEDIFAFLERPDLTAYLAQGIGVLFGNVLAAAWEGLLNVLILPAFPVGLAGLIALLGLRRSVALRRPTALALLLLSGSLTFASTVILFPVATLWGTFLHASGPLLVALVVLSALGGDALVARISAVRKWRRPNIILAPIALLAVTLLLSLLQVRFAMNDAARLSERYAGLAASLERVAGAVGKALPEVLMTDRPMWISASLERSAIALPDEPLNAVLELAATFDAYWLVVVDGRGRFPAALLGGPGRACLAQDPVALESGESPAWLMILDPACERL